MQKINKEYKNVKQSNICLMSLNNQKRYKKTDSDNKNTTEYVQEIQDTQPMDLFDPFDL